MVYVRELAGNSKGDEERALVEALVENLNLRVGATLDDVAGSIAAMQGKSISLEPVDDSALTTLTGLWIETADTNYVFFRSLDPVIYKIHSIFHEFGHILLEHHDCEVLRMVGDIPLGGTGLGGEIRRARARGLLVDSSERMAELVAYALTRRLLRVDSTPDEEVFG
ncbi:hypothetical protein ABIE18_000170 [Arthrobacter sp. 2762]